MAAGTTLVEEAPAITSAHGRMAWAGAVGAVVAIVSWLRLAVTGHADMLWAEDGGTFLREALVHGPEVIFEGYNGYAHLVPRLAAEAVALMPVPLYGAANTVVTCLLAGLCGAVVFRAARRVLSSDAEASAAALVVAVIPQANMEAIASLAHVHWFLLYAAVWVVVSRGRHGGWMVFLAVSSSPLALLLAPSAWRHWRWAIPGVAWQLSTMAVGGRFGPGGVPGTGYLTDVAGVGSLAIGTAVVAVVVFLLAGAARLEGWLMLAASLGFYVAAMTSNGQPQARYAVLPAMLLWASVIIAVSGRAHMQRAVAVLAVVAVGMSFPAAPFRVDGEQTPCGYVAPVDWVTRAPCRL